MIIVNLKGRLGNQLFQWAAARYLCHFTGSKISLHTGEKDRRQGIKPPLMNFNLPTKSSQPADFREVFFPFKKFSKQLQQLLPHVHYYRKSHIKSLLDLENFARFTGHNRFFLNGYFMSSHIAEVVRPQLLQDLVLREDFSKSRQHYLAHATQPNTVALHIRRGDFLKQDIHKIYGVCTPDYYIRALKFLGAKLGVLQPLVFSDDIEWCKQTLSNIPNITFFDVLPDGKDVQDFMIMSKCAHQIIANSTFSWWAAYLNQNPDKQIVAPFPWKAQKEHANNRFLMDDWHRIDKYRLPTYDSSLSPRHGQDSINAPVR
ncbi:Glycosyl transferase family 11 [Pseudovibrio sp. Tun.PSC04-5.I4]|nr:Glycosyl transferase family 11 [Pseudovibrio sp. Tun.PSC04-5.I4]